MTWPIPTGPYFLLSLLALHTVQASHKEMNCYGSYNEKPEVFIQEFTTMHKPPMKIIGIECRTSNDPVRGPVDIPQLWEKFYRENILHKIPSRLSDEVIALYCDYESDHTGPYSCVIGCKVDSFACIPSGMVAKVVPASSFALFKTKGEFPQSLIDTWKTIWRSDLSRSYAGDYEVYGEKFLLHKEVEVLIALTE